MSAPTQPTCANRLHAYSEGVDLLVARWLDTVALRSRAEQLRDREGQSVNLARDLDEVRAILARLVTDIDTNAVTLKSHCDLEAESGEAILERAHRMSHTHCKWVDYAEARLSAAEVMHAALATRDGLN